MSEEWLELSLMTASSVLSALNVLDRCDSRLADTPSCANCVWKFLLRQTTKRCQTCRTLLGNLSTSMSFCSHHARLETFLEEGEWEGEWEGEDAAVSYIEATSSDIPQCFSHFTYAFTEGRDLVCNLQGV